jgi:pimeloyl-ACP methyl ester carboxylesterase
MIRLGPLFAEVTEPESEKFTAPLVLIHGLWERAVVWRRFAGYLAHRGWRCIALERRADVGELGAHRDDLRAALAAIDAPPVLLGHDVGALLALHCADQARAVVALAALVGPPLAPPAAALRHAGSWFARWRGAPLHAPRGRWRNAYPNRAATEPAVLVRQLLAASIAPAGLPTGVPCAVFAKQADEVSSVDAQQALAAAIGAPLQVVPGTHAITGRDWEAAVAAVHRWIIPELGVDLLALYEEAMQPE